MSKSKLLFNSSVYIVLGFLAPAINFILLPIYTKYLEASDYALITQAGMIQSLFGNFLGFGIASAFGRFFYDYYQDKEKLNEVYSTAILSHFISGGAVIIIFSLIGDWVVGVSFKNNIFTYWEYGIFAVITALLINIQTVSLSYYRNQEKALEYAGLAVLFFLSVAASIYIGVVIFDAKARGSIVGRFIGTSIPITIYLVWYFWKHPIKYSKILNRKMLLYGLPIVPYTILNVVIDQADRYTVERLFDMRMLGLYGFGFLIAGVNNIFISSVNSAISPQIYRKMGDLNATNRSSIIKLMSTYISVGILANIGITVLGTIGIFYFLNEEYRPVAAFFPLLSIAYIPRVFYTSFMMPSMYHKNTKIMPLINLVTFLISIVLFITLAPIIGIFGICITVIVIKTTQMILMFYYVKYKKLHSKSQPLFKLRIEGLISVLFFAYVALWYLPIFQQSESYKYLFLLPALFVFATTLLIRIIALLEINPYFIWNRLYRK